MRQSWPRRTGYHRRARSVPAAQWSADGNSAPSRGRSHNHPDHCGRPQCAECTGYHDSDLQGSKRYKLVLSQ